ncbi:MAG: precorrin-2 C(20)-methyltransferase [Mogibacterium sp.]|nr:precorrin-2 C(20)-methyltransferase [Mogibacterium sp.]
MENKGILYGVGVGPGDPELMTLKAVRVIRACRIIAVPVVPGRETRESLAYRIAVQAVPELEEKELLAISRPMTREPEVLEESHRDGAARIRAFLDQGEDVAYLTLGDPAVYSSFSALQKRLQEQGCDVRQVSGVPSFCAAAAVLGIPLAEGSEPLRIFPELQEPEAALAQPSNLVLMKHGRSLAEVREQLTASGRTAAAAENCGLPDERLYPDAASFPDRAGYFTVVLIK